MRMYWAARTTMRLRQLAQFADTPRQLGGRTPSSSTKNQPQSPQRGYTPNQPRKDARGRSRESSRESHTDVAIMKKTSNGEQRTRVDGYQENTSRALSPVTIEIDYFCVRLGRVYTMKQYPFR